MLEVSELFAKAHSRAQKFVGRSDLPALAQIAAASYVRARERTGRLMFSLNANHDDRQYCARAHELDEAENMLVQALIEYAAVLRAMGESDAAMDICRGVETQAQLLSRRPVAAPAPVKLHCMGG